jgi:putative addiction module component (TIGR02574 family)
MHADVNTSSLRSAVFTPLIRRAVGRPSDITSFGILYPCPRSLSAVLELPVEQRLRLAEAIWDSIVEVPESLPLPKGQREELDRRLDAYYANPEVGSPWPDVRDRLLAEK